MLDSVRKHVAVPHVPVKLMLSAGALASFGVLLATTWSIHSCSTPCSSTLLLSSALRRTVRIWPNAVLREVTLTLPMVPDMEIAASKTATAIAEFDADESG